VIHIHAHTHTKKKRPKEKRKKKREKERESKNTTLINSNNTKETRIKTILYFYSLAELHSMKFLPSLDMEGGEGKK